MNIYILPGNETIQPERDSGECIPAFAETPNEFLIQYLMDCAPNPDSYREIGPVFCIDTEAF